MSKGGQDVPNSSESERKGKTKKDKDEPTHEDSAKKGMLASHAEGEHGTETEAGTKAEGEEGSSHVRPHESCLTQENGPFAMKGRPWSMTFSTPQAMPNQTR